MSLMHWWPLNNDCKDYGCNPIHATPTGNVGYIASGKIGYAGNITTDGQAFVIPNGINDIKNYTRYSMSCWIYLTSAATNHSSSFISFGNWNAGTQQMTFGLYSFSSNAYWRILVPNQDSWSNGIDLSTGITLNTWYHIAIVYDGVNTKGYVNGQYVGACNYSTISQSADTTSFYLGAATYYSGFTMHGRLNDVRIYDHALSQLEISEIAKACVLHYDFEDPYVERTTNWIGDKGTTFADWSSYGFGSLGQKTILENNQMMPAINGKVCKVTSSSTTGSNRAVEMATWVSAPKIGKNMKVSLSAYVKGNGPTVGKTVYLHIYNSNGTNTLSSTISGTSVSLTNEWQRIGGSWTWIYDNPSSENYSIYVVGQISDGESYYISNVQFEVNDYVTPFVNTSYPNNLYYNKNNFSSGWPLSQSNSTKPTLDNLNNIVLYGTGSDIVRQSYTYSSLVPILPSTSYTIRVKNKRTGTPRFRIYFYEKDKNGNHITTTTKDWTDNTTDYVDSVLTLTTQSNTYQMNVELNNINGTNGSQVIIKNGTLELYETANEPMIYDCSGYNRHGQIIGDYDIQQDAIRGLYYFDNKSINFTDSTASGASYILTDLGTFDGMTAFTWSMWCKVLNRRAGSGWYSFSNSNSSPSDYNTQGFCQRDNRLDLNTTSSYYGSLSAQTLIADSNWHHYVITFNGSKYISYRDGSKVQEINASGTVKTFRYLWLGINQAGGAWRQSRENWSDVQLFATALTADQIKTLYERKAAIGKNGSLVTHKVVEKNVMDTTNLVYNGGLELGNNSGFNRDYNSTYKALRWNTVACTNDFIEINRNDTYTLSFDWLYVSDGNSWCYFVVDTYDENKQFIDHAYVNHFSNTETTLASALNNGATTAVLTSAANWCTTIDYRAVMGVFNNDAYGYTKAVYTPEYKAISGNTLTLKATWTGPNLPAGTRVANCYHGAVYCYPWSSAISSLTSGKWYHYSGNWTGNQFRFGTRYVKLGMIYGGEHYVKNLSLINKSRLQLLQPSQSLKLQSCVDKDNCVNTYELQEVGIPIRYIRDSLKGSTANSSNHWVELEAFNTAEENIIFGKKSSLGNWQLTDEKVTTSPYYEGGIADPDHSGYYYVQVDIGYITNIQYLKIWHYYGDSRKYNNITQVSSDGVHWIEVFNSDKQGKYTETSSGHKIYLTPGNCRIYPNGDIATNNLIEN